MPWTCLDLRAFLQGSDWTIEPRTKNNMVWVADATGCCEDGHIMHHRMDHICRVSIVLYIVLIWAEIRESNRFVF